MIGMLLSANIIAQLILIALTIWGYWVVFAKCEKPKWYSFIPVFREYQLGKCADRETDARVYVWFTAVDYGFNVYSILNPGWNESGSFLVLLVALIVLTCFFGTFIYAIRIYSGLCDLFGVKKRKLWWMIVFDNSILLLIFGLRKKYQPKFIYVDERDNEGAALSGIRADALEEGLTVNIEERTASDFFKKRYLLRDIHLNIQPGHMVLLLGGSGAGKTTFLNAVNGYEKAKAEILLDGNNVYEDYAKMKYKVGFVPQMDLMRTNDTVGRTLMDAAKLRLPSDTKGSDRRERVLEVLRFFGLEPVKDKLCDKLSGGQRKRLSIAMEYISNPDLFILDEPDSGLDGVMARELMEGLRKIADQGKIVIVITHSPDRVIDLFDDVIVLAKDSKLTGRLTYFGPVEEAKKFFERDKMEQVVLRINRKEEGGEGLADSFIEKYAEVCHG